MTIMNSIVILLLPGAIGLFFMDLFFRDIQWNSFFRLGLGYALGFGVIVQWMFLAGALGLPLSPAVVYAPLLCLAGILSIVLHSQGRLGICLRLWKRPVSPPLDMFERVAVVLTGIFIAVSFLNALVLVPVSAWDGIATVAYKAKFFYYEQTFAFNRVLPHASYPLHVPLLMTWTALSLGQWHEYLVKIIFSMHFCALIVLSYGFLRSCVSRRAALLGTVFVCCSNYVILHSFLSYRDLPLAVYNCAAVFLLLLWRRHGSLRLLILAGLFSGMAASVKLEGLGYAAVHCALAGVLGLLPFGGRKMSFRDILKNLARFSLTAALLPAAYVMFKVVYGVPLGEANKTEMILCAGVLARVPVIIGAFLKNMFWTTYWGWNWYVFAVCLLLCLRGAREMERALLLALSLFFSACFALFLFTPNYQYITTPGFDVLLPRLMLHFFPLCPVVTALMLERVLRRDAGSPVED